MLRAHHWPIPGGDKGLAEDYPRRHKPCCLRQSGPLQSELRDGDRLYHNRASQQSNSGEVVGEPTNGVVRADFPQIYPLSGQTIEPFPGLEIRLAPIPTTRIYQAQGGEFFSFQLPQLQPVFCRCAVRCVGDLNAANNAFRHEPHTKDRVRSETSLATRLGGHLGLSIQMVQSLTQYHISEYRLNLITSRMSDTQGITRTAIRVFCRLTAR